MIRSHKTHVNDMNRGSVFTSYCSCNLFKHAILIQNQTLNFITQKHGGALVRSLYLLRLFVVLEVALGLQDLYLHILMYTF